MCSQNDKPSVAGTKEDATDTTNAVIEMEFNDDALKLLFSNLLFSLNISLYLSIYLSLSLSQRRTPI